MKRPKASQNKAVNVETSAKKTKLQQELGRLTFEIGKLQKLGNGMVKRSNEIAQELEKLGV
jgi:hypothetical protein